MRICFSEIEKIEIGLDQDEISLTFLSFLVAALSLSPCRRSAIGRVAAGRPWAAGAQLQRREGEGEKDERVRLGERLRVGKRSREVGFEIIFMGSWLKMRDEKR